MAIQDHPLLIEALAYWASLPKIGRFPQKKAVDPITMPRSIIRHLCLHDVLFETRDITYTLIASEPREMMRENRVGRTVSEFFTPEMTEFFFRHVDVIMAEGLPVYSESSTLGDDNRMLRSFRIVAPLSKSDGETADSLVVASTFNFEESSQTIGPEPIDLSILDRNG